MRENQKSDKHIWPWKNTSHWKPGALWVQSTRNFENPHIIHRERSQEVICWKWPENLKHWGWYFRKKVVNWEKFRKTKGSLISTKTTPIKRGNPCAFTGSGNFRSEPWVAEKMVPQMKRVENQQGTLQWGSRLNEKKHKISTNSWRKRHCTTQCARFRCNSHSNVLGHPRNSFSLSLLDPTAWNGIHFATDSSAWDSQLQFLWELWPDEKAFNFPCFSCVMTLKYYDKPSKYVCTHLGCAVRSLARFRAHLSAGGRDLCWKSKISWTAFNFPV